MTGREHSRPVTRVGLIDLLREGVQPLDFGTVSAKAMSSDLGDGPFLIAGLESVVAFKRLAGRPRDRNDLLGLEARHGPAADRPRPRSGGWTRSLIAPKGFVTPIEAAKSPDTRQRRIDKAVEALREGRKR